MATVLDFTAGGFPEPTDVLYAARDGTTDVQLTMANAALYAGGKVFNALDYGVNPDGIALTNMTTTNGSASVSSASYTFTAADVGKLISIAGAGAAGAYLNAAIGSVNAGAASLVTTVGGGTPATAGATIAGTARGYFGSNNVTALNSAATAAAADAGGLGGTVMLPAGIMVIDDSITVLSKVSFRGQGMYSSLLKYIRTSAMGSGVFTGLSALATTPYMDCRYTDFGIDLDAATGSYSVSKKHFYIQFMVRPVFSRLFLTGSLATSIGTDFLVDAQITDNVIMYAGRGNDGSSSGGAAIGLGTTDAAITVAPGVTRTDSYLVSRNHIYAPKRYGVFFENQSSTRSPGPIIVSDNIIHMTSISLVGIADCGSLRALVANNRIEGAGAGTGIAVKKGTIVNSKAGQKGRIEGNLIRNTSVGIEMNYSDETAASLSDYTIDNNSIWESQSHGIHVITPSTVGYTVKHLSIRGNEIADGQYSGIAFTGTAPVGQVKISDNSIRNNGRATTSPRSALYFGLDATAIRIQGNDLYDDQAVATQAYGLEMAAGADLTGLITDNYFNGNATAASGLNSTGTITATTADNIGYP